MRNQKSINSLLIGDLMTMQQTYDPISLIQPSDFGVWLFIDELIEAKHLDIAKDLLNKQKKRPVTIYPSSQRSARAFVTKILEEAKKYSQTEETSLPVKQCAQALVASVNNVSQTNCLKNPGWLEAYNKFSSSFGRFAKLHVLSKMEKLM